MKIGDRVKLKKGSRNRGTVRDIDRSGENNTVRSIGVVWDDRVDEVVGYYWPETLEVINGIERAIKRLK